MKKRKLKYLLLSGLLVSAISGCGKLEEEREKKLEEEATNLDTIHDTSETNEKKYLIRENMYFLEENILMRIMLRLLFQRNMKF